MAKMIRKSASLMLRLYIAGNAPNSILAIANAKALFEEHFGGDHSLEIVDLLDEPRRALTDGIIVTPTLLRISPLPVQRVIGTLADATQVMLVLGRK